MPVFRGPKIQIGSQENPPVLEAPPGLGNTTTVTIGDETFELDGDNLEVMSELGRGTYGDVHKMRERRTGAVLAVKRIRHTCNTVEQQRTTMDLEIAMKSLDCPYTVHFYGAMFRDGDVWICMEVMDISLDRLYTRHFASGGNVPEPILAKVAFSVVSALHYLHTHLKVIHRDVKPSNILASTDGTIKICDFGISAYLVDSIARTREAGTNNYLAPERINPEDPEPESSIGCSPFSYSVKADVWSLGISLLEVGQGHFPYPQWATPFDQLKLVVEGPPPIPGPDSSFTPNFLNFIAFCLEKKAKRRASYTELLKHPFIADRENNVKSGDFVQKALDMEN